MTLVIGIRCSDGVVMASDGAATLGVMGQLTARQPTKKIYQVGDSVLMGFSGKVGLGQRLCWLFENAWNTPKFQNLDMLHTMTNLRENFWKLVSSELSSAKALGEFIGTGITSQDVICELMIALPCNKNVELLHFDAQMAPEAASDDLPFFAIGSGQHTADPFLAFIRETIWGDEVPTVHQGMFAAYWTVSHGIDTSPGGVAGPIQMAVLEKDNSEWKSRILDKIEVDEHQNTVDGLVLTIQDYWKSYLPTDSEEVESPPKPN